MTLRHLALVVIALSTCNLTGCKSESKKNGASHQGASDDVLKDDPAKKKNGDGAKQPGEGGENDDDKQEPAESAAPVKVTSPAKGAVLKDARTTIEGTCEGDDDVVIRGDVAAAPVSAKCEGGKFSAPITLTGGDGEKKLELSQPANETAPLTDHSLTLSYCTDQHLSATLAAGQNGKGDASDPYRICSAKQLDELRNAKAAHAQLMADIDLGVAPYNKGTGWVPIGTTSAPYKGTFDGQGREIKALYINNPAVVPFTLEHPSLSFFGTVDGGKIQNVVFRGARVTANRDGAVVAGLLLRESLLENVAVEEASVEAETASAGVLVATGVVSANDKGPTLRNLSFDGTLKVKDQAGGIIYSLDRGSLTGCRVTGQIQGNTEIGGAAYYMVGDAARKAVVSKCTVAAEIVANAGVIGGVAAKASANAVIERSAFTGSIESKAGSSVGGILAAASAASGSEVRDSYVTGTLKGVAKVGGILGTISLGQIGLKRAYFAGKASTTSAAQPAAGIVGSVEFAAAYVADSWSGLYFDGTVSPGLNAIGAQGGFQAPSPLPMTAKTTAELSAQATFAGWDFDEIWSMPVEGGRPVLQP